MSKARTKKGPKRRGRRPPPPPVPSRGEIPTAEQLMDRLGLGDDPPPLPDHGNGGTNAQKMSGPPPVPHRAGVPTAQQLMDRMDEMKQQPRRKKKKKKKQKKSGVKLPSAYDFQYKRKKVSTRSFRSCVRMHINDTYRFCLCACK